MGKCTSKDPALSLCSSSRAGRTDPPSKSNGGSPVASFSFGLLFFFSYLPLSSIIFPCCLHVSILLPYPRLIPAVLRTCNLRKEGCAPHIKCIAAAASSISKRHPHQLVQLPSKRLGWGLGRLSSPLGLAYGWNVILLGQGRGGEGRGEEGGVCKG